MDPPSVLSPTFSPRVPIPLLGYPLNHFLQKLEEGSLLISFQVLLFIFQRHLLYLDIWGKASLPFVSVT
jgi:hypothetical protein